MRRKTPSNTERAVLTRSARRCALCFQLIGDLRLKEGQIAHLDHDPANSAESNLAWLCLPHHSLYDSRTSQHKNYTAAEVKFYRAALYKAIRQKLHHAGGGSTDTQRQEKEIALVFVKHPQERPSWVTHIVKPVYRMVLSSKWVVTNVSARKISVVNAWLEDPSAPGVAQLFLLKEGDLPGLARAKPTLFLESNQIGEMECNFVFQPPLHKPPAPVTATVMVEDNLANRYRFSSVTFWHMFPVNDGYMNAYFPQSQAKP